MFLLVSGRYYNASNSAPVDDNFLALCNLRFPLTAGRALKEEEQSYFRKNSSSLEKLRAKIEKEINQGRDIEELALALELAEDINFFLTDICQADNIHLPVKDNAFSVLQINDINREYLDILPEALRENYAVINKRIYPLKQTDKPSFVCLSGRHYTLASSKMTVEDVESLFQKTLSQQLKLQAIKDSEKVRELSGQAALTEAKNEALIRDLKVERHAYCFECGDKGFDIHSRIIYCPIGAHYNQTTGKSYSDGQSAATLSFSKKTIGSVAMFAERPNKESPLITSSQSHCLGTLKLEGNSLEDKIYFLRNFANEVKINSGFYAARDTSSDNQDYQY